MFQIDFIKLRDVIWLRGLKKSGILQKNKSSKIMYFKILNHKRMSTFTFYDIVLRFEVTDILKWFFEDCSLFGNEKILYDEKSPLQNIFSNAGKMSCIFHILTLLIDCWFLRIQPLKVNILWKPFLFLLSFIM